MSEQIPGVADGCDNEDAADYKCQEEVAECIQDEIEDPSQINENSEILDQKVINDSEKKEEDDLSNAEEKRNFMGCDRIKGCKKPLRPQYKGKTLLKCSRPVTVTLPVSAAAGSSYTASSLDIDTSQFDNPCIHFDFISNIVASASVLTVNFQIFKQCEGQLVPTAVSSVFRYSSVLPVTASDSFSFSACSCNGCKEKCCNYSVKATVLGIDTVGIISFKNMTLSAFVVETACDG